ncbi:MAG: Gfo/Idh/MocA family oxidoreductase, partial [Bacteroidetes bacterium]|nr:Gfo/Idh/MocA family oxidoreductase [Bacteroidota bacterium]
MEKKRSLKRRDFLRNSLASVAAFTIVPRHVLGGPGYIPPSDQLTKGIIGVGGMGRGHIGYEGTKLLAVCDVDKSHLKQTLDSVGKDVSGYSDFRELLARPDIDVVHIATPPHWHGLMSIAAARAGKDIWCEKPMTRTIGEGIEVVKAVKQHGRMFRLNTWFRFKDNFYGLGTDV